MMNVSKDGGIVGGDYFGISKNRRSNLILDELLKDINLEDYYIIKASAKFRLVDIEELKLFKHVKYILFKKDKYDIEHINQWLIITNLIGSNPKFLGKPFPNFDPYKIKIIKL